MASPLSASAQLAAQRAAQVRERAASLGFDRVAFARADQPLDLEHERLQAFLRRGMHGQMGYLQRTAALRARVDGPAVVPGAKTVICLTRRYGRGWEEEQRDPPLAQLIARYARGRDYHGFVRKRAGRLAAWIRQLVPGVSARAFCDTGPLLERAWAARAGLGFIGHNGLLIVPGQGSYLLLAEVVTTMELPFGRPLVEECRDCSACLDSCPTGALVAPRILDPRRCLSYATIELDGQAPGSIRDVVGERLFGCDRCQEVCPHNRCAPARPARTEPFRPLERWHQLGLADLAGSDDPSWAEISAGSPLRRLTTAALGRNALWVARARLRAGDPGALAVVQTAAGHADRGVRQLASELLRTADLGIDEGRA